MKRRLLSSTLVCLLATPLFSQVQKMSYEKVAVFPEVGTRHINPDVYLGIQVDYQDWKNILSQAPYENSGPGALIALPTPDGGTEVYEIWKYNMLEPALAAMFPEIGTYLGRSTQVPSRRIRLDHTYQGLHAMVMGPGGTWSMDPAGNQSNAYYQLYYKKDLKNPHSDFVCSVNESILPEEEGGMIIKSLLPNGTQLKTYRLALAATGEYTAFHGGTLANAQSAQATTMNRVNGVYETDLAVRMVIVANNNQLIYTNAGSDPYTNGDPNSMITQNQNNITSVIGSANYDIGHVFGTNSGGLAGLGVVCSNSQKARGVTGSGAPVGDPFDIDYVAHEMGHQFNGSHSFNSSTGSCGGGNRSASNAYEPGSGSTIMAYAGICGSDDLQPNSDAYFHARSFETMRSYITTGNGNSCDVATNTGNAIPTVEAGPNTYRVPLSTPFRLTAVAQDADAGDQLTYCWEQYNTGSSVTLAANPTSGSHPLFRSFDPDTSATRVFPRMSLIVNNQTSNQEKLPYYGRRMNFRVTVRDNHAGGGGVSMDSTSFIAVAGTGPFRVTAPNTAVAWTAGTTQTVTWDIAGTTANGINCQNVNIRLSTDGGYTYPIMVLANTPNDGTQQITVPSVGGSSVNTCRIMVESVGNIFFDISNANFTISPNGAAPVAAIGTSAGSGVCKGTAINFNDQSSGSPTSWQWTFTGGTPSSSTQQNPSGIVWNTSGTYNVSLTVTNGAGSNTVSSQVVIYNTPTATTSSTISGGSNGTATATPSGGMAPYTVTWSTSPVQTGNTASGLAPGTYTATITDARGCQGTVQVTVASNISLDESNAPELNVFPNPFNEGFNVDVPFTAGTYRLTDAAGKTVLEGRVNNSGLLYIAADRLSAGMYILKMYAADKVYTRKLLKN
ncbi:MAG: T9SS type A sorting domain-containing protein [Bacteroidia bacterium]|nr:T9SS type A sorting domain-containing protein [Bacteroidia bacterium]